MIARALILALATAAVAGVKPDAGAAGRGQRLAESACSRCHAVGRAGDSPNRDAPPFRALLSFEPGHTVEEVFARGILLGHPGMPQFGMSEQDQADLLAYLRVIQVNGTS
jgi:mono/diheme cytochrome c family protein